MILYTGKSQLDGSPIVAVATIGSTNQKTGDMVQTWILRSDVSPVEAVRAATDGAVCGECPHRHSLGGACYVMPFQAPRSVYAAWKRGAYMKPEHVARVRAAVESLPVRIGAYGDPVAVPVDAWHAFLGNTGAGRWTGYTHQWRLPVARAYQDFCMASVDNIVEAEEARAMGWRFFLVVADGHSLPAGAIECLADARGLTCAECAICDGTRFGTSDPARSSVWIAVHGSRARRFRLPLLR